MAPDISVHALAKIRRPEHVDALRDGSLRMGSIEYYRKCFDELEGVAEVLPTTLTIDDDDDDELIFAPEDWGGPGEFRLRDVYVFSLFAFHGPRPSVREPKAAVESRELKRAKAQARMLARHADEYGETTVMIKDATEFRRRIVVALKKAGYRGWAAPVQYYEPSKPPRLGPRIVDVAFNKQAKYRDENEYRFVVFPGRIDQCFLHLNVGSIRDITICFPTRDFEDRLSIDLNVHDQ